MQPVPIIKYFNEVVQGEFDLNFGNFQFKMTLLEDYVVGSIGGSQNYSETLTDKQLKRWQQAERSTEPLEIIILEDVKNMEKLPRYKKMKNIQDKDEYVRDFA
jgi:hypothetical protein